MPDTYDARGAGHGTTLAARALFGAHVGLIAFSTLAMLTIVNRAPGPWLLEEPVATVMRLAWKLSGPLYVTLGALAMVAFLAGRLGVAPAVRLLAATTLVSLGMELMGTSIGLPFGDYHYSSLLGYRILGRVPFPIPLSWFYMLTGSLVIVARRASPRTTAARWRWAALAGVLLVAWDVAMDPAMVHTGHWSWGAGDAFRGRGLPDAIVSFFTGQAFYGMPLSNWLGWFLTATLISRLMLAVIPPRAVIERLAPSRFPVVLYLANGIMPVALCLRDRLWWAAGLGAVAMMVGALPALWTRRDLVGRPAALGDHRPPVPA